MKIILLLSLLFTSPALASDCLTKEQAAENILAYVTNSDFIEFSWEISQVDPEATPVLHSLLREVDPEGEELVRIYGKDARKVKKELYTEFYNALTFTNGSHVTPYIYIGIFDSYAGENRISVNCVGNVEFYYEYSGPL